MKKFMRVACFAFVALFHTLVFATGTNFIVRPVYTTKERLMLFMYDEHHRAYRSFERIAEALAKDGRELRFAMNGGMYEADGSPVGLLVIDGHQIAPLNRRDGDGNFFMKPNGVFALTRSGPRVVATEEYASIARNVIMATQSGPMLVKDGSINAKFSPASTSRHVRNGVCARGSVAYFVISEQPVTFYDFAAYFRDVLHCKDALYLDGAVSSTFDASRGRSGPGADLGPILGVVR